MSGLGLTDAELADMRADVALLLPDTAIIYSKTAGTADPYGGTVTYTASGTVSCRVDPLGGRSTTELEYNLGRETMVELYRCTLPYDVTLDVDYRITINSVDYDVVQMDVAHSWNVSRRVIIARTR